MRRPVDQGSPIVLKIGSSSLSADGGGVSREAIRRVVEQIQQLWAEGHPCVLVTSGAVAAGLPAMGLSERPSDIQGLQVAAAIGQSKLMELYGAEFGIEGRLVGQILITRDVLARRDQYLHARGALERMLSLGIVPIVNENDTVVVDELKLGDNDRLAAIVSHLVGAGMMILLSDTLGLYSDDPWFSEEPELLSAVRHTDRILDELGQAGKMGVFGSGGVATKVAAARMAAWSGVPTVIASALESDVVGRAVNGGDVGTWVEPRDSSLSARKLWIGFGLPSQGEIEIDAGAARAVSVDGRSLLAAGVTRVSQDFDRGVAVGVIHNGDLVAKGLTRLTAAEIQDARGQHSSVAGGAVIHRDNLVVLI